MSQISFRKQIAERLAATNGFSGGYGRTGHSVSAVAFTGSGTGMERDWAAEGRTYLSELPSAEEIGHRAAERALQRVGSTKPKTGTYSVIYDERVSSSLIGHLLELHRRGVGGPGHRRADGGRLPGGAGRGERGHCRCRSCPRAAEADGPDRASGRG